MPSSMTYNSYCLNLGDGQKWQFVFNTDVMAWGRKLVSMLELKNRKANGHPRLFFTRKTLNETEEACPLHQFVAYSKEELPKSGWMTHDLVSLRFWYHQDVPDVICEIGTEEGQVVDVIRMWLSLLPIYQKVRDSGGLPLHAALISFKEVCVLLSAPGGTGKSTCCRRLPAGWHELCDDETLIVYDRNQRYLAHPFPSWSDHVYRRSERTWNVQQHLPISAIFFLEQAEADEAIRIGQGQAAIRINSAATQVSYRYWRNLSLEEKRKEKNELFENACKLARAIPSYILRVSLTGRFWEQIARVPQHA